MLFSVYMRRMLGPLLGISLGALMTAVEVRAQTHLTSTTYNGTVITGDIIVDPGITATFKSGATFTGTNASLLGSSSWIYWQQSGTLSAKAITIGSNSGFYLTGVGSSLTLDSASTATGTLNFYSDGSASAVFTNQGTLTHTGGSGSIYAATFNNSGAVNATGGTLYLGYPNAAYTSLNTGTVTADGSGTTIYIRGPFDNNGTLTAQNSAILRFDGTNTSANLGNVVLASGGHAQLNGTIDNTSSTLAAPTGGAFDLLGGTILNGSIATGAVAFTTSGGYLNGATLLGDLNLSTTSAYVYFSGGANFSGANAILNNSTFVYWQQVGTLSSKAITFASGSGFYLTGVGSSLTLDSATTATGSLQFYSDGSASTAFTNQGNLTHTGGSSSIYASIFTNTGSITANAGTLYLGYPNAAYTSLNTGTVTADGSGTTIYIRGPFDNNGALTAQNSAILRFDGTNTSANLGNVTLASGGRALLNGTIDNTSATLTAPTGGAFELFGGTILNGSIATGAVAFTTSGGYLNGATLVGDLNLSSASAYVYFNGGANFSGANASLNNSTFVYWQQVGTLSSKAITFASGSGFYLTGVGSSLTLDSATTATGSLQFYSDGSASTAFTNQGNLTHTGGSSSIYASTFTNTGSITANAGTLYLGYPSAGYNSTNTGTVTADGSGTTIYVRGLFDNNGTLTAQNSAILRFDGATTTANLGNVVLASGGHAQLNGTIDNTSSTLTAPTGGVYELLGGTISNGSIATGALAFTTSGGYLSGATLLGDLGFTNSGAYVYFNNGASFTGTNGVLGANNSLYWQQTGTLASKALTFASSSSLYVTGVSHTLTLDAATTATGTVTIYTDGSAGTALTNLGTITHTAGSGSIYSLSFTNAGSITANAGSLYLGYPSAGYNSTNTGTVTSDGSGTTVYLRGAFDNNGTVTAQNSGILRFDGSNTTANLGNVVLTSGGRAQLNGTIDNTSSTLSAPTGGVFELYGGTVSNGSVATGALVFTPSGGYLSGATLLGDLGFTASNAYVYFNNGASFTGANAVFGTNNSVYWQQVGTLSGKALTFGSGSSIYVSGTNDTLTLDAATTATGTVTIYTDGSAGTALTNLGTITHTGGSGSIYSLNFNNAGSITATAGTLYLGYPNVGYNSTNTGTITADGSGTTVYLRGPFDNNGTVTAQNSAILRFDGSTTTANLGNVVLASGGRAQLNGTLDNTSATLSSITGGIFELYGGTINNGTVGAGVLGFTTSGGTLNNVVLNGDLNFSTSSIYTYFTGGTTFTGANAILANSTAIYWQQVGTLTGKTMTFGTGASIYVSGVNNSLTLGPGTSLTGAANLYTDGSVGTTITNQGSITHTVGTGQLYARNFTNSGTITATSGNLYLGYNSGGYTFNNAAGATVTVNGGNAYLQSPLTNAGTVNVQSGTLYAYTFLTNGSTGLVQGSGTLNGNLTMAGGTLAPGNSIGTLTLSSSAFAVTGASTLLIEVSGATADKVLFQNPTSNVDIGSGLLSLSLQLLSAPTPGTTYTIMSISGGANVFSGTFAGMPNNGDSIIATFSSQNYLFSVTYLSNAITLDFVPVPEPSTYALLGAGLAMLAVGSRRRWRRR